MLYEVITKGSNVTFGRYYTDENDKNLLSHYYGKSRVPLDVLKEEYNRLKDLPVEEVVKNSPIKERNNFV